MTNNHDDLSNRLRAGVDRGTAPDLSSELVTGAADRTAPRLTNPALRVAGGAVLTIAALAVAAVVVVPSLTPHAPLFTAAATSGQTSAMSTEGARVADSKIGWWVDYNYSAGPSLSTEGGSGQVYRLAFDSTDPVQRATSLAAALGLDGTAVEAEWSDAAYPTWVVGPTDGTDKNLSLSAFGIGDWWFNDPTAAPTYVCDDTVTPEQSVEYGCVLPADAPENLAPTGDEARAMAVELFASTGYTVEPGDIEIYSDDWSTSATAYLTVDGERTAITWNATWSNTGELSSASGHTLRVEAQGTFNTVSPTDAVARLDDTRWYGSPGPDFQGGVMAFATDVMRSPDPNLVDLAGPDDAVTDASDQGDTSTSSPVDPTVPTEPTDSATPEPGTVDPGTSDPVTPLPEETPIPEETPLPEPTPEVVDVTIDNATATLVLLWDVDGNAWLVPGYAMQMEEGWWNSVVSLVDGVIELPEPMEIEPGVIDPELADTGVLVD